MSSETGPACRLTLCPRCTQPVQGGLVAQSRGVKTHYGMMRHMTQQRGSTSLVGFGATD
ncbi:hypothetical protein SBP02_15120 [Pseudomonas benzenivorans]|uniref:Uncharacterized protein n=1 Tax=Pseudomonas benzenivorans TaxID=556533 RepID=A0ABZ0PSG5_9PSED|nr:hypothetical protein [Pseudomonas benzenivorans]WPC04095.1 hypothetical protein SBP02_15120 [Pseudomonas benzenivorans]